MPCSGFNANFEFAGWLLSTGAGGGASCGSAGFTGCAAGCGAGLATGALLRGCPTSISHLCPGAPCAGFNAIALLVLGVAGIVASVGDDIGAILLATLSVGFCVFKSVIDAALSVVVCSLLPLLQPVAVNITARTMMGRFDFISKYNLYTDPFLTDLAILFLLESMSLLY
jgi:hypothetical protein